MSGNWNSAYSSWNAASAVQLSQVYKLSGTSILPVTGNNNIEGDYSVITGGYNNVINANYASANGINASANKYGQWSVGGGQPSIGSQISLLQWYGTLNTTNSTELFLGGVASNRATLDDNRIWIVRFDFVAVNTTNGNIGSGERLVTIQRDIGANTTSIVGTVQNVRIDQNNGTSPISTLTISADITNGALSVFVTPIATTTTKVKVVAFITELPSN